MTDIGDMAPEDQEKKAVDPFDAALDEAITQASQQADLRAAAVQASTRHMAVVPGGLPAATGAAKGVVEGVRFLTNLTGNDFDPKQVPLISDLYQLDEDLTRNNLSNGLVSGIAQFGIGMLGVGKVGAVTKIKGAAEKAGVVGRTAYEIGRGALAGAIVLDPHEARLSDLLVKANNPLLNNAVTQYLASDPNDSIAEGRFKNAIEGIGLDLALVGVLSGATRLLKMYKTGAAPADIAVAEQELADAVSQQQELLALPPPPDFVVDADGVARAADAPAPLPKTGNLLTEALDQPRRRRPGRPKDADRRMQRELEVGLEGPDPSPLGRGQNVIRDALTQQTLNAPPPQVGAPRTEGEEIVETIIETARDTGTMPKGRKRPTKEQAKEIADTIGDAPKIETNGIGFRVLPHSKMRDIGKAYGIDTTNWLGAGNRKTGEIIISDKVLAMPPAQQARIIAHEIGHVLQNAFEARVPKEVLSRLRSQMRAASKELRPEIWTSGKAKGISKAATRKYLNSHEELFADSFSLWKNEPDRFRELAPDVANHFDQHFAPWLDTDLTSLGATVGTKAQVQTVRKGAAKQTAAVPGVRQIPQEDDVAKLMADYEADQEAIKRYGSREAAQKNGYSFGPQSNLPWQKLQSGGPGLREFTDRVATTFKAELDNLKGEEVLSDSRVQNMIDQRVKAFNDDPEEIIGEIRAAGANANTMVANMEAAFAVANRAADDLYRTLGEIDSGNLTRWGGDEAAANQMLADQLAVYIESMGNAQAIRAAMGRGMRRLRKEFQITPETLANVRSMNPDELRSLVRQTGGDPRKLAETLRPSFWRRTFSVAGTFLVNNLLWNYKTHVANLFGNVTMLMGTPAMRALGSFAQGSAGRDARTLALREFRFMLSTVSDAWQFAKDAYVRGDSVMDPQNAEAWRILSQQGQGTLKDSVGLVPVNTYQDFINNGMRAIMFAIGQPTRVLGMQDEFFKQLMYRAQVMAKASLDADQRGLMGREYNDYIAEQLSKSFDEHGRALDKEALLDAERRTFQQPLIEGTIGKISVDALNRMGPWTRFVVPFQKTPINLLRTAWKLTPGLNMTQKEYRQMIRGELGAERQAEAYGNMMVGTAAMLMVGTMAYNGQITGAPPSDPNTSKALRATGWQPYSFVVRGADGTATYIPFNRLDPVGLTFGIVADVVQITQMTIDSPMDLADKISQIAAATAVAVIKNVSERSYVAGLSDAIEALNDPETSLEKAAGQAASNLIPFSSALRNYNPDPTLREARSFLDKIMATVPGFSQNLPAVRDAFGDVQFRNNYMSSSTDPRDIVDTEQQRMIMEFGTGVVAPNPQPREGIDLRQVKVDDGSVTAWERYQELAGHPPGRPSLKEALANLIVSDNYQRLPDGPGDEQGTRLWALMRIVRSYREAALKTLYRENPILRKMAGERQMAVREAGRLQKEQQEQGTGGIVQNALDIFNQSFGGYR